MFWYFAGGVGTGLIIMLAFVWFIGMQKDKPQQPFPLNPELIKFWETSIDQKMIELKLLTEIVEILKKEVS